MGSGSLGRWAGSRVPPPPPPPPLVGVHTARALLHQGPEGRPGRVGGDLEQRVAARVATSSRAVLTVLDEPRSAPSPWCGAKCTHAETAVPTDEAMRSARHAPPASTSVGSASGSRGRPPSPPPERSAASHEGATTRRSVPDATSCDGRTCEGGAMRTRRPSPSRWSRSVLSPRAHERSSAAMPGYRVAARAWIALVANGGNVRTCTAVHDLKKKQTSPDQVGPITRRRA